jgi:hypothetical protein
MGNEAGREHFPPDAVTQMPAHDRGPRGGDGALNAAAIILREADELLAESARRGLVLKLAGSAGVLRHCSGCLGGAAALGREPPGDLDFFAYRKQQRELGRMFADLGYRADPSVAFSQEYGIDRLIYLGDGAATKVDVFLDALRMSHTIDFKGRLDVPGPTARAADLLLAKLQIHEITEKDIKDLAALLATHPLGDGDDRSSTLDAGRVVGLMRADWGLCHTALVNLAVAGQLLAGWGSAGDVAVTARARVEELRQRIELAPKSLRWKARARVGTRARWYEEVGDAEQQGQGDAGIRER